MGEYAKRRDGTEIKIGTCESMYYLRYEDRGTVVAIQGNIDPAREIDLFWRVPFPDEDHIKPGDYQDYNRGQKLYKAVPKPSKYYENCIDYDYEFFKANQDGDTNKTEDYPGIIQMCHEVSGLMVNITCYHGEKMPEGSKDIKPFYNGRDPCVYELRHIKNTNEGMKAIVSCRYCGHMWRYELKDIVDYIPDIELRNRIMNYIGVA